MNYRHAFHAGNFADVVKHALLVSIVEYLKRKDKKFRVIDTHAGRGRYDLSSEEATRTGEHLDGISRLMESPSARAPELQAYLDIVRAEGAGCYPGSPLIARRLMRAQDRLVGCEVEPTARKHLISALRRDKQARIVDLDGWVGLPAFVPPNERRGVVLIDPPFEKKDEFERMAYGFDEAFANGRPASSCCGTR